MGDRERRYVLDAVESGWVSSTGRYLKAFEDAFAVHVQAKHAVSVSNGTAALHLALHSLGVGPGDEIIVPDLTFVATAHAVLMTGATPVFVDVDPVTWCMDPVATARAITPRTRAILPVHLYGQPCAWGPLSTLRDEHQVLLIEDAAQAIGTKAGGRPAGSLGTAGCFSFFGNKLITTGEGGMIVTSDDALAVRLRFLRGHGVDPARRYFHAELAFNYRMTNLQAALGLAQLEGIEALIAKKRAIYGWYQQRLQGRTDLQINTTSPDSSYWMTSVLLPDTTDRATIEGDLADQGIETRPFFVPMSQLPHLAGYRRVSRERTGNENVANRLSVRGLNLPSGCGLTEDDVDRVVRTLLESLDG